jgi:uncharacterized protein (TIGR02301 family)
MTRRLILAAAICAALLSEALAQSAEDYARRRADLVALSAIFGELHHIRRTCEPRLEGDIWRERMKKLLELEAPQADTNEAMVESFNRAYRRAQSRFSDCDRGARDFAAARAAAGEPILSRLTAPLYEAAEQDPAAPFLWSNGAGAAGDGQE